MPSILRKQVEVCYLNETMVYVESMGLFPCLWLQLLCGTPDMISRPAGCGGALPYGMNSREEYYTPFNE